MEGLLKETKKIDRVIFKAEKFIEELSKDMIQLLLQEIKIKTFQKILPNDLIKIFSAGGLVKSMTHMLINFFLNYFKKTKLIVLT